MTEPRVLKGFRDSLPSSEITRERLMSKIKNVFSLYGYAPIDTPCLEYEDILLSKSGGETEKQIYAFEDNGKRRVALRFDLTVPFARFVAEHVHKEIELPFKRYHIAKVWRGEKSQAGRYREFYQCDIDEVGSVAPSSDAEILNVIASALLEIGINNFKIHFSHRALLSKLIESLEKNEQSKDILRLLDKMPKIGEEEVRSALSLLSLDKNAIDTLISFASLKDDATVLENISFLIERLNKIGVSNNGIDSDAIERLSDIYSLLNDTVKPHVVLDLSITRGLDYYTGFVFETFIIGSEHSGSISSGGRYDNLTSNFTKEVISGVGGSIGLDRLLSIIDDGNTNAAGTADVYVVSKDGTKVDNNLVSELRKNGIRTDVAYDNVKNSKAYKYTEINKIPYILFVSKDEYSLKNIITRTEHSVSSASEIVEEIKKHIAK